VLTPETLLAEDRRCRGGAVQNAFDVDVDHILPLLNAQVVSRIFDQGHFLILCWHNEHELTMNAGPPPVNFTIG
jgi:hypothetical protein